MPMIESEIVNKLWGLLTMTGGHHLDCHLSDLEI